MRPALKTLLVGCTGVLASILLGQAHPFGNPDLYAPHDLPPAFMPGDAVPARVRTILTEKCADCHSLETRATWYERLAPASWLVEHDVVEARKRMNLSLWESYSPERQEAFRTQIVWKIRSGQMPPAQYLVMHRNARVTDAESQVLSAWARGYAMPESATASQPVGEGDAARGKDVFERRCTGCHALDQNREGPQLRNVYGRAAGTVKDFEYSAALKKTQIVWDEGTLAKWLTDPDEFVPGNNMGFRVANPQERQDLISFLRKSANK
jgi:cytochrome c